MNIKRFAEAEAEFKPALAAFGGLDATWIDRDDIAIRSDFGIVAMLEGKVEEAHRYFAYTGAGQPFGLSTQPKGMRLPPCQEGGIAPNDVGIVQFSIADDGHALDVAPIYASRQGPAAAAFAQAVAGWSWSPDEVKAIKPFFRVGTRFELRCTTTADATDTRLLLRPALEGWLDSIPGAEWAGADPKLPLAGPALEAARVELARRERASGPDSPTLVPLLAAIGASTAIPADEAAAARTRALAIANKVGAPVPTRAILALAASETLDGQPLPRRRRAPSDGEVAAALAVDPRVVADAPTLAAIRLVAAERWTGAGSSPKAKAALQEILADRRLDEHAPARVAALVRLATLDQRGGDTAGARAAYAQSGLDEQQCALVDFRPALRSEPFSHQSFPEEALHWGFSGYVMGEFDIDAAGRPHGVRTVLAYPPFVFDETVEKGFRRTEWAQSYRPNGGLGCGGEQVTVAFRQGP